MRMQGAVAAAVAAADPQLRFPPCPPLCPAPRQIGAACRAELLSWEQGFNSQQAAWGQPTVWIWQPLYFACGLAGGGGGTRPPPLVTPPPGTEGGGGGFDGEEETFCDKASLAAEEVGGGAGDAGMVGQRQQQGACQLDGKVPPCRGPAARLPS